MLLSAFHTAWIGSMLPAQRRFARALAKPRETQLAKLEAHLRAHEATAYGRAHGFESVLRAHDSLGAWQRRLPVARWDALEPWIDRVAHGEPRVLSVEPPRCFERSGGSTSATKLLPITARFLAEIGEATSSWLVDLHRRHPLIGRRSYWSISPVARAAQRTPGGIPIGMSDDAEYFGSIARDVIARSMAVPSHVASAPDVDTWRSETVRHLLSAGDLALISVWSPSFLTLLLEWTEANLDALLGTIPVRRAESIRRGLDREGRFVVEALWPELALISCWADGPARALLPVLKRFVARTTMQPKGLLATEGVVSVPLGDEESAPIAITSHFLEWIDLDHPTRAPLLSDALRVGGTYSPLLTTGAGLARYHLADVVRVVGMERATPRIRFEGKLDRVSDVAGEKLHASFVERCVDDALRATIGDPRFVLLAPRERPAGYRLYVESEADEGSLSELANALDRGLAASHPYSYARDLGQLAPIDARRVARGEARYLEVMIARGQRAGDVKPSRLDTKDGWDAIFGVPS
ncbi:GH3 family domain-containing protein [Sandaracinus amylolyticus]|uniref:Putative auxin-responsive-like protein n=1 Tax=Sandaracinus amylolyticus TaxID=927083 RepID=A0A0F6YJM9_9BACT|nr:GH3 auxin-responsive promoter family protein [Sandaracinus amylolyticus]AKF06285.1 putative auxin-responsive-like protein [Sandaracinus amylolyticus]